jgi:hypothetical protein
MTRRDFIILAGVAIMAADVPLNVAWAGAALPASFGGPTPNDKFYVTSYGGTPKVDVNAWRLRIIRPGQEPG